MAAMMQSQDAGHSFASLPQVARTFGQAVARALAQARRSASTVGVMFIALDRSETADGVPDQEHAGALLAQVAQRLQDCVRSSDIVGHLGGNEFASVLFPLARASDAALVASKMVAALAEPFSIGGQCIQLDASVGISIFPHDGADAESLLRSARAAMLSAKEAERGAYRFCQPAMNVEAIERAELLGQLRSALARDEFVLHYQPKLDLASDATTGLETLLRWQHPTRGLLVPAHFLTTLEESGLIVEVGDWVLRQVCAQLHAWRAQGLALLPVAINVSPRQLQRARFDEAILAVLDETGTDPRVIEIEVTETGLMSDGEESARLLRGLHARGATVAVDDFGTGYTSLGHLHGLPLRALKIDRSFIQDLTPDGRGAAITLAVIVLAHALGLKASAEAVETKEQAAFLRLHGCDEAQGHHFVRPMPADECAQWLRQAQPAAPA